MGKLIKKQKRPTKTVICYSCEEEFEKAITEINRTEKNNGKHYCSLKCCGEGNKHNLGKWYAKGDASLFIGTTTADEFTGFREFMRRAKGRNKLGDLTLDDLKIQWEKQNGICPYTGISLKLPFFGLKENHILFDIASLDRIDSSKPYQKNNIVFVSIPINYMKHSMTEDETIKFCKIIATYWSNRV